ncbi:MAG: glycosyltransferase family 4 protein [Pseudomonadota bacterium]
MPGLLSINNYNYRRGGAEVVFLEHNRLLSERGWQISRFAMSHPKNYQDADQDLFASEIEFGENYSLTQKLINASRVLYSFEAQSRIAQVIERRSPDIAHAHNIYHHLSPAIFPTIKRAGIPAVLTLHDLKLACPAYTMRTGNAVCERCKGGRIENVIYQRCIKGSLPLSTVIFFESALHRILGLYANNVDKFVVPSRFLMNKLIEWGWPEDRFEYIPNFVDCRTHPFSPDIGEGFIYFGRLSHEKGIATLLQAAAKAKQPLTIVGTGPQDAEMKAMAQELGIDAKFLGYKTGDDLHKAIHAARAVVLPSTWYENAPLTILEANALGRPVIGAQIGGIPEMIRHGQTGLTFPSGDADALADCLTQLATMPNHQLREMSREGRRWMEQEFSPSAYIARNLSLYESLGVSAATMQANHSVHATC